VCRNDRKEAPPAARSVPPVRVMRDDPGIDPATATRPHPKSAAPADSHTPTPRKRRPTFVF
jgi:hypothetical protein